jgi:hypothetical protein
MIHRRTSNNILPCLSGGSLVWIAFSVMAFRGRNKYKNNIGLYRINVIISIRSLISIPYDTFSVHQNIRLYDTLMPTASSHAGNSMKIIPSIRPPNVWEGTTIIYWKTDYSGNTYNYNIIVIFFIIIDIIHHV